MSAPNIVLVNAPFVLHEDTGLFLGLDKLIRYEELKAYFATAHGTGIAERMFPYATGIRFGVRAGSRWPHTYPRPYHDYIPFPFIMGYAASWLRKNGVAAEILDAVAAKEYSYEYFLADVKARRPDIVIVECATPSIAIDVWVAERIAEFAEVALAGPHLTDATIPALQAAHPSITYFLKGEYINSALEMARSRRSGVYESEVVRDLDALPFPDRSFAGSLNVCDAWLPDVEGPQLQIWGSKGCPFKCKFCLWPQTMYKGHVSLRDPKNIAREIIQAVAQYGYKHVYFDDDTFNIGNERISRLCGYMKEIGLPWGVMARLDTSPLELFEEMIASGCVGMKFGVESFNARVLAGIDKGLGSEAFNETLVTLTQKYPRVKFHLTMMRGLPGQTEANHEHDMAILASLGFGQNNPYRTYQLSTCVPFPGTRLYEEIRVAQGEEAFAAIRYDGKQV